MTCCWCFTLVDHCDNSLVDLRNLFCSGISVMLWYLGASLGGSSYNCITFRSTVSRYFFVCLLKPCPMYELVCIITNLSIHVQYEGHYSSVLSLLSRIFGAAEAAASCAIIKCLDSYPSIKFCQLIKFWLWTARKVSLQICPSFVVFGGLYHRWDCTFSNVVSIFSNVDRIFMDVLCCVRCNSMS